MQKLLTFTLMLVLSASSLFSQSLERIPIEKKSKEASFTLNNQEYKAYFGVVEGSRRSKIEFQGRGKFTYSSIFQDSKLEFEVFSSPKLNFSYLLINNYLDITLGAEVYLIDPSHQFKFLGYLPVGAYNSVGSGRMNYNSILPYITIFYTEAKTYFSFEVPLMVLNPGETTERIIRGCDLHYTLENMQLKQNITE